MPKILIADDNETIREMLAEMMTREGFDVSTAQNGIQALRMCYKDPFDLAIVDMVMPGLDGLQTISKLRQDHPGLKIIAISGGDISFDGTIYLDLVRDKRAHRTFAKPIPRRELIAAVNELLPANSQPL